jgi:hypothetical protein
MYLHFRCTCTLMLLIYTIHTYVPTMYSYMYSYYICTVPTHVNMLYWYPSHNLYLHSTYICKHTVPERIWVYVHCLKAVLKLHLHTAYAHCTHHPCLHRYCTRLSTNTILTLNCTRTWCLYTKHVHEICASTVPYIRNITRKKRHQP